VSSVELHLKPGGRHRVLRGHPWVFSNQLLEVPAGLEPGGLVDVIDGKGRFVGRGYGHPHTLIAARLLTRDRGQAVDEALVARRLDEALALRRRVCPDRRAFRQVYGEADGLPGVVIDRFEGERTRVVVALGSAGAERMLGGIVDGLKAQGVDDALLKSDGRGRRIEGLEPRVEPLFGDVDTPWVAADDGVAVSFDPHGGQKTGLFLDMWANRRRMVPALTGRVADLYCYVGQWGLHAAARGADVVCVDRSEAALAQAQASAGANGLELATERSDVLAWLRAQPPASFDAIVCDPPAFVQGKKQLASGLKAYKSVFAATLTAVRDGGIAVLASCSSHVDDAAFGEVVHGAAGWAKVDVRVLARGEQGPDHPVPLVQPESRYLKCWLVSVRSRG
jgi:23S rRNA (cytosine1962-C5)-methyltransferase